MVYTRLLEFRRVLFRSDSTFPLDRLLRIARSRWRTLASATLVAGAIAAAMTWTQPGVHLATTTIVVHPTTRSEERRECSDANTDILTEVCSTIEATYTT